MFVWLFVCLFVCLFGWLVGWLLFCILCFFSYVNRFDIVNEINYSEDVKENLSFSLCCHLTSKIILIEFSSFKFSIFDLLSCFISFADLFHSRMFFLLLFLPSQLLLSITVKSSAIFCFMILALACLPSKSQTKRCNFSQRLQTDVSRSHFSATSSLRGSDWCVADGILLWICDFLPWLLLLLEKIMLMKFLFLFSFFSLFLLLLLL